jgi:hypothetical protein
MAVARMEAVAPWAVLEEVGMEVEEAGGMVVETEGVEEGMAVEAAVVVN